MPLTCCLDQEAPLVVICQREVKTDEERRKKALDEPMPLRPTNPWISWLGWNSIAGVCTWIIGLDGRTTGTLGRFNEASIDF